MVTFELAQIVGDSIIFYQIAINDLQIDFLINL